MYAFACVGENPGDTKKYLARFDSTSVTIVEGIRSDTNLPWNEVKGSPYVGAFIGAHDGADHGDDYEPNGDGSPDARGDVRTDARHGGAVLRADDGYVRTVGRADGHGGAFGFRSADRRALDAPRATASRNPSSSSSSLPRA